MLLCRLYKKTLFFLLSFVILLIFASPSNADATEYGTQADGHFLGKIPNISQLQQLNPQWIRSQPNDVYFTTWPSTVKVLLLINGEEITARAPGSTGALADWKTWIDANYIPYIKQYIGQHSNFPAIEIWNEEDLCSPGFCPKVPAPAYAYMLKNAAQAIKAINPAIKVVMGGLASGNLQYLTDMKTTDSSVFNQVDAVGTHPYGLAPDGWCASGCSGGTLPFGDLANGIAATQNATGKTIWVTEFGSQGTDQAWQAEYVQRAFSVLARIKVPVVIWYAWNDSLGANFGLMDTQGKMKPSGLMFRSFNTQPTPFLQSSSTITPTPSSTSGTISILLHGIGTAGDNANPHSNGNMNPLHPQRTIRISLYNSSDQLVTSSTCTITYDTTTGAFTGTITVAVPPGNYIVKVLVDTYLQKQLPGFIQVTANTITLPQISLVTGDMNSDNKLDILDYNILLSCFGSKSTASSCLNKQAADSNDDGAIDGSDYNLFLRELSVQTGN